MLLGHARGKVGDLVFSRSNGQQVVRARAAVVKNPQTESQMIQRIFLNTISQAYSNMVQIVDHSFEGVQKGQKTMEMFLSRNLKNLRTKVQQAVGKGSLYSEIFEFSPIASNFFAVNDYEIAKGTLPEIAVSSASDDAKMSMVAPANTYKSIIDHYGLNRGDQLTFVAVISNGNGRRVFKYARVILDPVNADGSEADLESAFIANGAINLPNGRNEGEFTSIEHADGVIKFSFTPYYQHAAAVIVSRRSADGTWLRSNATLTQNEDSAELDYSLQQALDMLKSGALDSLSEQYLNNSGTGALPNSGTEPVRVVITSKKVGGYDVEEKPVGPAAEIEAGSQSFVVNYTPAAATGVVAKVQRLSGGSVAEELTADGTNGTATVAFTAEKGQAFKFVIVVDGTVKFTSGTYTVASL